MSFIFDSIESHGTCPGFVATSLCGEAELEYTNIYGIQTFTLQTEDEIYRVVIDRLGKVLMREFQVSKTDKGLTVSL